MSDEDNSCVDFYEDIPMHCKCGPETEMENLTSNLTTPTITTTFHNKTNSVRIESTNDFASCKIPLTVTSEPSFPIRTSQEFNNNTVERNTLKKSFRQHFCAHGWSGVKNSVKKQKRKRTMFTTEQIIALEEVFRRKPYINREERKAMTRNFNINEKSIKVWFQNRRRLTDKRSKDYSSDSPSSEDMSDTISERLAIIEAQINQNTDAYGYVRLDNNTMRELVCVIDEYLSQDFYHVEEVVHPVINESKVIYEPISPVSLTDNSDDIDQRSESFSREAKQLTDIKSILFF